ncbi:uncharacterized protein LOC135813770 [Sycon ciliatum]|uniref:uncharacterized protein LOC135813770 n=1 Tax=Sycon ciliatum TaxID=27933 RepID=UPI0031F60DBC
MAKDERLQKCAGGLRTVLDPDIILDELLVKKVITKGEHDEVSTIAYRQGKIEGNRCLLRHMMIGKSKRQIDGFLDVTVRLQRSAVRQIFNSKLGLNIPAHIDDAEMDDADEKQAGAPVSNERQSSSVSPGAHGLGDRTSTEGPRVTLDSQIASRMAVPVQESNRDIDVRSTRDDPVGAEVSRQPAYSDVDIELALSDGRDVTDDMIVDVATRLQTPEKINRVGVKLGYKKHEIDLFVTSYREEPHTMAVEMLKEWRAGKGKKRPPRTIQTLAKALKDAGHPDIAAELRHLGSPSQLPENYCDSRPLSDSLCSDISLELVNSQRFLQLARALGFTLVEAEAVQHRKVSQNEYLTYLELLTEWKRGSGNKRERTVGVLCAALEQVKMSTLAKKLPRMCDSDAAGLDDDDSDSD